MPAVFLFLSWTGGFRKRGKQAESGPSNGKVPSPRQKVKEILEAGKRKHEEMKAEKAEEVATSKSKDKKDKKARKESASLSIAPPNQKIELSEEGKREMQGIIDDIEACLAEELPEPEQKKEKKENTETKEKKEKKEKKDKKSSEQSTPEAKADTASGGKERKRKPVEEAWALSLFLNPGFRCLNSTWCLQETSPLPPTAEAGAGQASTSSPSTTTTSDGNTEKKKDKKQKKARKADTEAQDLQSSHSKNAPQVPTRNLDPSNSGQKNDEMPDDSMPTAMAKSKKEKKEKKQKIKESNEKDETQKEQQKPDQTDNQTGNADSSSPVPPEEQKKKEKKQKKEKKTQGWQGEGPHGLRPVQHICLHAATEQATRFRSRPQPKRESAGAQAEAAADKQPERTARQHQRNPPKDSKKEKKQKKEKKTQGWQGEGPHGLRAVQHIRLHPATEQATGFRSRPQPKRGIAGAPAEAAADKHPGRAARQHQRNPPKRQQEGQEAEER